MKKIVLITSWDSVPVVIDIGYAARILGVTAETVRKACASGDIPAFKIRDMWRINKKDLMVYCRERVQG